MLSRQRLSLLLWAMFLLPMAGVLFFGGVKLRSVKVEALRKSDSPELFLAMQAALVELRYLDGITHLRILAQQPELRDEEIHSRYFVQRWRTHFQKSSKLLQSLSVERFEQLGIDKQALIEVLARVDDSIDPATLKTYRQTLDLLVRKFDGFLPKDQDLLSSLYARQFSMALAELDLGNCLYHLKVKKELEGIEGLAIFTEKRWGHRQFSTSIRDALFSYRHDSGNPLLVTLTNLPQIDNSAASQQIIDKFSQRYNWVGEDEWTETANALLNPFIVVSEDLTSHLYAKLGEDSERAKNTYLKWVFFLITLSVFGVLGALFVLRGLRKTIDQIQLMAVQLAEGKQWSPVEAQNLKGELGELAHAVNGVGNLTATIQLNLSGLKNSISNDDTRPLFKTLEYQGRWKQVADSVNAVSKVHESLLGSIERESLKRLEIEKTIQKKQKNSLITRFAEGISHDFNNLLTVIIGHSEESKHRTEMVAATMTNINQAGNEARGLVRKLMTAAGLSDVRLGSTSVTPALKSALKLIPPDTWHYLTLNNEPSDKNVLAEETVLTQSITELLKNAILAVEGHDSPVIEITTMKVEGIGESPTAEKFFQISVKDNGRGMDSVTLNHACEPFFTTGQNQGCRGLGLTTVHQLVEKAEGHLQIDSILQEGTTVTLQLPYSKEGIPVHKSVDDYLAELQNSNQCVLLVDDNDLVLKFTSICLRKLGFEVITAKDGDEGCQVYRDEQHRIGFIVSDILMPNLNGPEMIRKMKSEHSQIPPFIFITGFSDNQINQSGDELQHAVVLQKPFSVDKLEGALQTSLSESLESSK